jgi:hypothetical protein
MPKPSSGNSGAQIIPPHPNSLSRGEGGGDPIFMRRGARKAMRACSELLAFQNIPGFPPNQAIRTMKIFATKGEILRMLFLPYVR